MGVESQAKLPILAFARSLVHPNARCADHVHGVNAIGDVELPEPKIRATDEHASDLHHPHGEGESGRDHAPPGWAGHEPRARARQSARDRRPVRKVIIVGSTIFHPGIQGPTAPMVDANFANDPEVAHIVLRSSTDIILVGVDVTMTTLFSTDKLEEVAQEGDEAAKTLMP